MSGNSYTFPDGRVLEINVEMIDVTSALPQPDEKWTYTDAAGHEHYRRDGWPTLQWFVTERYYCEDCRDEHTEGEWICPLCEEVIKPGMRGPDLFHQYLLGMRSYYLDGQPITEEQAKALVEESRS